MKKGFTVIEMLTVIFIVGLLIAIVTPRFGQVSHRNDLDTVESTLRMKSSYVVNYLNDYGEVYIDITAPVADINADALAIAKSLNAYLPYDYSLDHSSAVVHDNKRIDIQSNIEDPWGEKYRVHIGIGTGAIIIASNGPDSFSSASTYGSGDFGDDLIVIINKTKGQL